LVVCEHVWSPKFTLKNIKKNEQITLSQGGVVSQLGVFTPLGGCKIITGHNSAGRGTSY